ncbi:MAG: C40 family peptidase [Treponemataceae bacterium]|nr:C40 family peptidase [Treponemataceae bacterium]
MNHRFFIPLCIGLFIGGEFSLHSQQKGISEQEQFLRQQIVQIAQKYVGVPYVYGAASPQGFDCSGFASFVYQEATKLTIPRSSRAIWFEGVPLSLDKALPGDILVFNTFGNIPSHVAILLPNDQMIHAVSQGPRTGVIISPLDDSYFSPRFLGVRRFIGDRPVSLEEKPKEQTASGNKPQTKDKEEKTEFLEFVGFTITNEVVVYTDKIPAQVGSTIQFVLTNGTGADGVFQVLFYKMALDPAKNKTIREERVTLQKGATITLEPITFTEGGDYKLILKTQHNLKRVERIWKVQTMR